MLGASKEAAQYEASKSRTVKLAREKGVVHPAALIVEKDAMPDEARAFVEIVDPLDYVIKGDGLFGGKAVVLPKTREEARAVVESMIAGEYGGSGEEIINFAKRKRGQEVSATVLVGKGKDDFLVLPFTQDYKRLLNGDRGPNTGGTGAYGPLPKSIVSPAQEAKINQKIYNLLEGMEEQGIPYEEAVIYAGLMMSEDLTDDESDLLEINVRFGDPESQVLFPLLLGAGVDCYRLLRSAAEGSLERPDV